MGAETTKYHPRGADGKDMDIIQISLTMWDDPETINALLGAVGSAT